MIRSEQVSVIIRFYPQETDDPFADYVATCTLVWESHDTVWIKALQGCVSRKHLVELALWLASHDVSYAKAARVGGKRLPGSEDRGTYQVIDLTRFLERNRRI